MKPEQLIVFILSNFLKQLSETFYLNTRHKALALKSSSWAKIRKIIDYGSFPDN